MTDPDQRGAIGFAEKVLELLDEGRFATTYKYAVLLALIDVCLERTQDSGGPPQTVTTRQLAEKIVEVYWPHTVAFAGLAPAMVLKQSAVGQAEIISDIRQFRTDAADLGVSRWESRRTAPDAYEDLVRLVEWKLIEMPLPRLQLIGQSYRPFIYEINWDRQVDRREVARYQTGGILTFDNRLLLKPGVGEYLLQLSGLLRPLIHRRWAAMVAQLNRLQESQLEMFLFGTDRRQTAGIRTGLWEIQGGRCFYCDKRVEEPVQGEVDHFVPWSRYPNDGLDNLVVADKACNGFKSNSLPAAEHLTRWARRVMEGSSEYAQLAALAQRVAWDRHAAQSLSAARAIYLRLPDDAMLWLRRRAFIAPDSVMIKTALVPSVNDHGYDGDR